PLGHREGRHRTGGGREDRLHDSGRPAGEHGRLEQRPAGCPRQPQQPVRLDREVRAIPGRLEVGEARGASQCGLAGSPDRTKMTFSLDTRIAPVVDTRDPRYQSIKGRVHEELLNRLNLERLTRTRRADAEPEIRGVISGLLDRETMTTPLSSYERESIVTDVLDELFGLGPLETLLADPTVSDILVNRADQVYVERNGRLELTDTVFRDDRHVLQIIERIVSSVGRRIDESSPMVDARLADGSRVNAVIPPLALDGPGLSIRRFRKDRLGAEDLVARGALTQGMIDFLKAAVACRSNVIVSGGTGSGKTTLLNVLSGFIADDER